MSPLQYLRTHSDLEHRMWVHHLNTTVTREELTQLKLLQTKYAEPRPRLDELRGMFFAKLTIPPILVSTDGPIKPLSDEDYERYSKGI